MRYARNMKALTPEENQKLKDSRVCIAGCGALGEYVFEMLGRIGVANLTIIDFDTFNTSNLNRQIYATVENLGCSKVEEAKKRMAQVNPDIKVNAIQSRISSDNALSLLRGHQVVVDALDNPASKIILQEKAAELQIPLVHGAISGWLGQVATILPGDTALKAIYPRGIEVNETAGNPSFTPALVAAIQVSQVIKLLIGRGELIRPQLLYIDLLGQHIAGIKLP
jgi:molybdopterin/thiamine biosynthesis adenylyltransferase